MNIKTCFRVGLVAIIGTAAISLSSCKDKKGATPLEDTYACEDEEDLTVMLPDKDVVEVPFTEVGNSLHIEATINNSVKADMVFDTGADVTLIGLEEAQYLYSKGLITDDDILEHTNIGDASGNFSEADIILLKSIQIGDLVCTNVTASVINKRGLTLLFGQTVLKRLPSYTIDNENKVIKFNLKSSE